MLEKDKSFQEYSIKSKNSLPDPLYTACRPPGVRGLPVEKLCGRLAYNSVASHPNIGSFRDCNAVRQKSKNNFPKFGTGIPLKPHDCFDKEDGQKGFPPKSLSRSDSLASPSVLMTQTITQRPLRDIRRLTARNIMCIITKFLYCDGHLPEFEPRLVRVQHLKYQRLHALQSHFQYTPHLQQWGICEGCATDKSVLSAPTENPWLECDVVVDVMPCDREIIYMQASTVRDCMLLSILKRKTSQ
jgi:hypothetical protein